MIVHDWSPPRQPEAVRWQSVIWPLAPPSLLGSHLIVMMMIMNDNGNDHDDNGNGENDHENEINDDDLPSRGMSSSKKHPKVRTVFFSPPLY